MNLLDFLARPMAFGPRYHGKISGGVITLANGRTVVAAPYSAFEKSASIRYVKFDDLPAAPPLNKHDIAEGQSLETDILMPITGLGFQYPAESGSGAIARYQLGFAQWFYRADDGTIFKLNPDLFLPTLTIEATRLEDSVSSDLGSINTAQTSFEAVELFPSPNGKKAVYTIYHSVGQYSGQPETPERHDYKARAKYAVEVVLSGGSASTFPAVAFTVLPLANVYPSGGVTVVSAPVAAPYAVWSTSVSGDSTLNGVTVGQEDGSSVNQEQYTDFFVNYYYDTSNQRHLLSFRERYQRASFSSPIGATASATLGFNQTAPWPDISHGYTDTYTLSCVIDGVEQGSTAVVWTATYEIVGHYQAVRGASGPPALSLTGSNRSSYEQGDLRSSAALPPGAYDDGTYTVQNPDFPLIHGGIPLATRLAQSVWCFLTIPYKFSDADPAVRAAARPIIRSRLTANGVGAAVNHTVAEDWPASSGAAQLATTNRLLRGAWNPRTGEVAHELYSTWC